MSPQRRFNLTEIGHLDDVSTDSDKLNDVWGYVDDGGVEYALVGRRNRMDIVDISTTPASPTVVSSIPGPTSIWRDIKTSGEFAFVVHDQVSSGTPTGLQVIDLSTPTAASVATSHTASFERAHNIWIEGQYLYACSVHRPDGDETELVVMDVSSPTTPTEIGTYTGAHVHDIYVRGDRAYAAAEHLPGVKILDVSDPTSPTELGEFVTPEGVGHNTWLSDDGDHCFVTNEVLGGHLRIYDVSDPTGVFQVGEYEIRPDRVIHNVYVSGDVAYISYYAEGVVLLDVSDPANPRELAVYDTSDRPLPDPPTGLDAMHGVWGLYPFFPSGRIAASDIERGLFVFERTRSPVDVMLCLDRSGSMSRPVPGGTLEKFELLQRATGLFTATWAPFATPDDRMGVVFFETDVEAYTSPDGGSLLRPFEAEQDTLDSYVDGQTTGDRTAMGAGLQRALQAFGADREARRVVVLFTDGKQNESPKVTPDADGDLRLAGRLLADYDAEVYTVGTGVSGVDWETLLADIANQTNGRHHFTDAPDQDLRDFFEDHLVRALRGQTVQSVGTEGGYLDDGVSHQFVESGTARRIAVTVSWDGDGEPDLSVVAPDGTTLPDPHHEQRGEYHRVASYRVPIVVDGRAVETQGRWTIRISGTEGIPYRVSMLVDDWELHPRIDLPSGPVDIGERLSIAGWLEEAGQPVPGIEHLRGTLTCPTVALGEQLSEVGVPDDVDDPERLDARERAVAALSIEQRDDARRRTSLELTGTDERLETAVWPTVPGSYSLSLHLTGTTETGTPVQRRDSATVVVPAVTDPTRTTVERTDSGRTSRWQVEPRDVSGARRGPGLADQIRVEPSVADLDVEVEDLGAGRYEVTTRYPETVPAECLSLTVEGVRVSSDTDGTVSDPPRRSEPAEPLIVRIGDWLRRWVRQLRGGRAGP
jgi:choice-of-anchor B domain-containing protein